MCGAELKTREQAAWDALAAVADPELPALSIVELGIVREVKVDESGALAVALTPTYSGCPATAVIHGDVAKALDAAGLAPHRIEHRLAPAWSSDWISAAGRDKLRAYRIVPPEAAELPSGTSVLHFHAPAPACPHCGSRRTEQLSAFGSTACKALHRCLACGEPFERFKPI